MPQPKSPFRCFNSSPEVIRLVVRGGTYTQTGWEELMNGNNESRSKLIPVLAVIAVVAAGLIALAVGSRLA